MEGGHFSGTVQFSLANVTEYARLKSRLMKGARQGSGSLISRRDTVTSIADSPLREACEVLSAEERRQRARRKFRWAVHQIIESRHRDQRVFKDGRFVRGLLNARKFLVEDFYFHLLEMRLAYVLLLIFAVYLGVSLLFGGLYYAVRTGMNPDPSYYFQCVFHSLAILNEVKSPFEPDVEESAGDVTLAYWFVYYVEATFQKIFAALFIGLIVDRLSRPIPRIIFSHSSVISSFHGQQCLMCRVANERNTMLVGCQASAYLVLPDSATGGAKLLALALQNPSPPMLILNLNLIHVIDEKSPLFGWDAKRLFASGASIWFKFSGEDTTFEKTFHGKTVHSPLQIVWGGRFVDTVYRRPTDHMPVIDFARFHDVLVD